MTADNEIKTIRELVDRMAQTQPENAFLVSPETGAVITFRGLQERSRLLSTGLLRAGLEPGDKIAFLLDNGLFTAQLFLGVMYGGFVAVPLNVRAGVSQLSYTLDHCDARVVYVAEDYSALLEEVMANVRRTVRVIPADVDDIPAAGETPIMPAELIAPEPEDQALLMYTSGSTGQPKAAIHSHRTVLAGARNSISSHHLSSADRSLLVLPLYHINAECVTLVPTLMSGGSVVVPHRFSVSQFWDWMDEYRCTWSALVPTIISQLLDWRDPRAHSREAAFQRIRFLRSSSAPLAPSLHREFLEKFKLLLIQAMGSSEAGNVFSNPLPPGENKIGSPGLPWGFEARIVNREGIELPAGESGEVVIRGPAVMQGYYKQPEETAAVLDPAGWMHTGDLAYQDEDGYFFVVGRSKELIIKGGVNIAPRQIDDVLESHPAVLEAASVGVPDHYLGEDLVAFVVLRTGVACDESVLLSFCEGRLGHFKTPTRIYFADDLPKGPSGKVQRLRLRDEATQPVIARAGLSGSEFVTANGNGHAAHNGLQAATSSIEQVIAESWAEVLSQQHVDSDSNFFALGGHSLLAVQCVSRLRERIPVALSLSDFFENATVAQQAALVRRRLHPDGRTNGRASTHRSAQPLEEALENVSSSVSPATIPPRDRTLPCPLSPGQRRLWFMEQLHPGLPVYNESEAVRLLGELNVDAMERALNVIVARHEVLRTTIQVIDNEPMAVVHESWPIQLKKIDLSALAASERQAAVERLLIQEPRHLYHLEAEPGFRATLLCLGPQEHVFILMMHHSVCDWSSEGVFWRELAPLYRSFSRNEPHALPALTIQHGDYAAWQVEHSTETSFPEDLAFWEENLRGAPQLLELPADRTRPPTLSHRGARQRLRLNPALAKALRDLGQQAATTLFTVFAAALNTLLYRYTGKKDILLGIPIADRDRKELQALIGFLLNTQVLRTELSGDLTFRKLLSRVQKAALDLYLHRSVPFEQVVRKLQPERNLSYSPVFQVMLIWRDRDQMLSFIGMDGLAVESLLAESRTSKFDLTLFVTDCGDEIWLEVEYSTDLFDEARIARMLGHYETLLESAAYHPDLPLAELPILTRAEREQILIDWNQTDTPLPPGHRLHDLFRQQAMRSPDAIAASFQGESITYRELDRRSTQLARHLRGLGVKPEVLTVICLERSIEMIVAMIAVLKAGGAYVPVDPTYPSDRISFMVKDSGAEVVVTDNKLTTVIPATAARAVRIDGDWPSIAQCDDSPFDGGATPETPAYVIYTSGSTGRPKGVVIPHRATINLMVSMSREPGLSSGDTIVAVTTLSFDIAGLEIFLPLIVGARIEIASREVAADPARLGSLIASSKATVMQATPATWRMLIASGWKGDPRLKVLCGGEAVSRDLADQLLLRSREVWNMYGPTETTIWSTVDRIEAGDATIPIGRPIENTKGYILDDNLQPLPIGIPGELYIAGIGLACGYRNQPQLTSERFVANPFVSPAGARMYRTGDVARYRDDGRIEFLGRIDHQVKIRGFRIELGEIESVLKRHPGVRECVVVARENTPGDKRLVAYFSPVDSRSTLKAKELQTFLRNKLPEYMIPAAFGALAEFPHTPNGKVDRQALTTEGYATVENEVNRQEITPRTPQELALQQIWKRVLGVQVVGLQENFFDLGGHSLLAIQLIGEINKVLNVNLTVPGFFLNPTIEGIAHLLQQEGPYAKPGPHLIPLRQVRSRGAIFFLDASMAMCRLAQLLDAGPAVFVTEAPLGSAAYRAAVLNKKSALPSLRDLAAAHVTLIRSQDFSGPCVLAGHSFSGLLAFEVAHRLRREGASVDMILLVDSWVTTPLALDRLKMLSWARAQWALNRRLERLWSIAMRATERMFPVSQSPYALDSAFDHANQPFNELSFEIRQKIYRSVRNSYQLCPLESRAVLFRSQDNRLGPILAADGTIGWKGLFTRGLEIVQTPGDHLSLLQNPHIQVLAQKFNDCIAKYYSS